MAARVVSSKGKSLAAPFQVIPAGCLKRTKFLTAAFDRERAKARRHLRPARQHHLFSCFARPCQVFFVFFMTDMLQPVFLSVGGATSPLPGTRAFQGRPSARNARQNVYQPTVEAAGFTIT